MPRSLQGHAPTLAVGNVDQFNVRGGMDAERQLETAFAGSSDSLLNGSAKSAFEAMRTLRGSTSGPYTPRAGVEYPRSPFGQALQEIARIATANVGLEIAFAEATNWDHHVAEGGTQGQIAQRLDDFARGLSALAGDLGEQLSDTVILTMSEFGRAVAENGNRGTDHGHGNAMLLIGGPVKGKKVHGKWPGLGADQRFEGRDLAVTTDFRDVFAEVATRHLTLSPEALNRVFPRYAPANALGLIRS
jgi:uncharacterized protein (DUF1501 family)